MWQKTFTKVYQDIDLKHIWQGWADIDNWPKWDEELEYCSLIGEFKQGNNFILKPKSGPKVTLNICELVPEKIFTDVCKFPGAKMYDKHELIQEEEGVRIINTTYVTGPLAFIWVKLVAKKIAQSIPAQNEAFINYLRKQHG